MGMVVLRPPKSPAQSPAASGSDALWNSRSTQQTHFVREVVLSMGLVSANEWMNPSARRPSCRAPISPLVWLSAALRQNFLIDFIGLFRVSAFHSCIYMRGIPHATSFPVFRNAQFFCCLFFALSDCVCSKCCSQARPWCDSHSGQSSHPSPSH